MTTWHQLADDLQTHHTLEGLSESQVESIILVLLAVIHADQRVSFTERMELDHMLMELPWDAAKMSKVEGLREHAAQRVSCATKMDTLLAEAAADLSGAELREKIFLMASILGHADGDMGAEELAVMKSLAGHFGLDDAKADLLIGQAEG